MASHYHAEPGRQRLEAITQQRPTDSDGFNVSTQLSIGNPYDSPQNTSTHLTFNCQTHANSEANLLFPLAEIDENTSKDTQKMSWHVFLRHLKSQQIIKNVEIFRKSKRKQKYDLIDLDLEHFPFVERKIKKYEFPYRNATEPYPKHQLKIEELKPKDPKFSHGIFPETSLRFPQQTPQIKDKFPLAIQSQKLETTAKPQLPFEQILEATQCYQTLSAKCPSESPAPYSLAKFPLHNPATNNEQIQLPYALNTNHRNWIKENALEKLPQSTVTLNSQEANSVDKDHMIQVQDSQLHVGESRRSLTTSQNEQTSPKAPAAQAMSDEQNSVQILADVNSINNTRADEVGYYAEKIERFQDAILALFEKIQNSFKTNHNSEHESTNAAKHDYGADNIRFALTPPLSVTSVRNIERNANEEVTHTKYDLGDLCAHRLLSQSVECSEVLDTLDETVGYGATKEQTEGTGAILVKSEEPTLPSSPRQHPSDKTDKTEYTSLRDYSNGSEILPNYLVAAVSEQSKVDNQFDFESDPINASDTTNKSNDCSDLLQAAEVAAINTCESSLNSAKVNEMTVTRLEKNKQENILCNDLQVDEMKFEMNSVKGDSSRALRKRGNLMRGSDIDLRPAVRSTRLPTDSSLSNNTQPPALGLTKNYSSSSYSPRPALRNENSTSPATVPKQPALNTRLQKDGITNRLIKNQPAVSETSSAASRPAVNSTKGLNYSNTDALSHRRPSLATLRTTQSTSLLSADLPHYGPSTTINQTPSVNRATSIDSSLEDVLPERTRLRRQRRLRTQSGQDEPEDPIERLNRLKARISASLSEVKGVLKQYSTEAENENENENQTAAAADAVNSEENKQEETKDGPVVFRFVKKIRRRSSFVDDDDTIEQKESERTVPKGKHENQTVTAKEVATKSPAMETIEALNRNLYTLKEDGQESVHDINQNTNQSPANAEVQNEINDKTATLPVESNDHMQAKNVSETNEAANEATPGPSRKTKRKIIVKIKEPSRRASLAAVEGSKIEPPVKLAISAKIHRRPSDSEAVVKKKSLISKINTSGVVEEVTPQPNIVRVQKSSTNNHNLQLAATPAKLKEEDNLMTKIASDKIDNDGKLKAKDNKSIHTDKGKDDIMPKPLERQQQLNAEIARQTNSLLSTQSVIDDAASLNEKTTEDSLLPPGQLQQKQQQPEQSQQATTESTATNFKSNELQAKGAMLQNVTTVLSSSTASEANSQIKRKSIGQQEDLHDLLQQETTIIKPSTTGQQHALKLVNQVGDRPKIEDISGQQVSTQKLNGNLESVATIAEKEQPQQKKAPTQQQQVTATTHIAHVNSENDNDKNDDIETNLSLKEPCIDQTTTSTHVAEEHHTKLRVGDEQSITSVDDTKTVSSPHISISSTPDSTHKTTTASLLPAETAVEEKAEASANQLSTMPELKLTPAPVQTADINSHPEHHKKKIIIKKVLRQSSVDKAKKQTGQSPEPEKPTQHVEQAPSKLLSSSASLKEEEHKHALAEPIPSTAETTQTSEEVAVVETDTEIASDELTEECSGSNEISESSTSLDSQEVPATQVPKKERKVKRKVIIKRQKRRLSIGDSFFQPANGDQSQNAEIETLEKPIAYVTDEEVEQSDEKDDDSEKPEDPNEARKPLKSCIALKEYQIGDEVLYAERFKKTQIKWRRGRVKERITSISYLLDIEGKEVSSHINYLKKYTGRKVSFGGKEYLEIDYEQLAEEEEKAEKLQRRTYSIWNMV